MLTSTVTGSTAPVANTSQGDLAKKDIFLKLLVAQMQYQDPMKPQDATAMSSQLAQFNMVEQQTASNKWLEAIAMNGGMNGANNNAIDTGNGASYLGHSVTVNQNQLYYDGTNQNFTTVLDTNATEAMALVVNEFGEPVRVMELGPLNAGATNITWDGLTDSGATAAQGNYTIQLSANDINGDGIRYAIQRSGIVEAVRYTSSGTQLVVGGLPASLTDISEIRL